MHLHVHGDLAIDAGAFSKGALYDARNPELLLRVHATLVDTLLLCYNLFIGSLTLSEQNTFYQESKEVAHLLGLLSEGMPNTVDDLRQYIFEMVHSDRLVATPLARQLVHQVLFPPAHTIFRPLMHINLQLTCALLPQPVRDVFGLEWTNSRQVIFDLSARCMRTIIPHLPMHLRELPLTRRLIKEPIEHNE